MTTLTVDVQRRQRATEFRLFGPALLIRDSEPVNLPLGGPRELLAMLLLEPGRHASYSKVSEVLGTPIGTPYPRELIIPALAEVDAALEGTGMSITASPDYADVQRREPSFRLYGNAVELDLDRCGRHVLAAIGSESQFEGARQVLAALRIIHGTPLEGLSGAFFTECFDLLTALRQVIAEFGMQLLAADGEHLTVESLPNELKGAFKQGHHFESAIDLANTRSENIYQIKYRLLSAAEHYRFTSSWGLPPALIFRELGAELHPELKQRHALVPVSIYLGDGRNHGAVEAAMRQYFYQAGWEGIWHRPPVIGSWFLQLWARVRKETAHLTPGRLGAEAERKVRIEVFDKDQAAIDNLVATGMAALIASLQGEENACVRAGAILVLKVDGRLYSTTLFQYQLAWLERNQVLLQDPEGLLKGLDALGTRDTQGAIEPSDAA